MISHIFEGELTNQNPPRGTTHGTGEWHATHERFDQRPPLINIVCYTKSDLLYHPHISRRSSVSYYWSYWWPGQYKKLSAMLALTPPPPHLLRGKAPPGRVLTSHHTLTTVFVQSTHWDHCLRPVIKPWSRWATGHGTTGLAQLLAARLHTQSLLPLSECQTVAFIYIK